MGAEYQSARIIASLRLGHLGRRKASRGHRFLVTMGRAPWLSRMTRSTKKSGASPPLAADVVTKMICYQTVKIDRYISARDGVRHHSIYQMTSPPMRRRRVGSAISGSGGLFKMSSAASLKLRGAKSIAQTTIFGQNGRRI